MPYIKSESREMVSTQLRHYGTAWTPDTVGDLNYAVSCFCRNYMAQRGVRYENLNALIGALDCAKMELYRRMGAPYEDQKASENGDVYP